MAGPDDSKRSPIPITELLARIAAEKERKLNERRASRNRKEAPAEEGSVPSTPGEGSGSEAGSGVIQESGRARALLKTLGEEFVRLREQNRTSAWAAYQRRIASNLDILVPNAIGLKEATSLLREIEEFMKNDAGASVATPSEIVKDWLNAGEERVS